MPRIPFLGAAALGTAVAAAALLTLTTVTGAAAATGGDSTSPAGVTGARWRQACTRLPARLEKVEKLRTRLHADAQTRGSLAFLQARIGTAKAAGHTDQARLLSDRLAVRKDLDASLPDILTHLLDAKQVCDARSAGTTS
jgi:hypothetical protein